MKIARLDSPRALAEYTARQLQNLLPLPGVDDGAVLKAHVGPAVERLQRCVNEVKVWESNSFDPLHSTQYCLYLYYLSNTVWRATGERDVPTRLFLLNKALNGIDLFYEIEMPEVFFIGHSVGIVLAKASYSNHLVLYQNSTVGKNHGIAPVIEPGVVMYPNTAIIGRCTVKANTVLAQGTSVINQDTPGSCYAFNGEGGKLICKPSKRDVVKDIFR